MDEVKGSATRTNESWNPEANLARFNPVTSERVEEPADTDRPPELKKGIPIIRAPSDDCLLYPNKRFELDENGVPTGLQDRGEGIAVHEGEWVEFVPMASMLQYLGLGTVVGNKKEMDERDASFDVVCEGLSKKIIRWNWTDIVGEPYPQPFKNPAVLRSLEDDELVHLIQLLQSDETEGQRKNA